LFVVAGVVARRRRLVARFAVVFLAVLFLAVLFRAVVFLAVLFRAVTRFAVLLLAVARFAVVFRAVVRRAVVFFVAITVSLPISHSKYGRREPTEADSLSAEP
jgi:hypothetical protein